MTGIPASSDHASCWEFLAEGVDHIMCKLQTGVSYSKYMSLYTVAYNYCTQTGSRMSRPHGVLPATSSDYIGSDLYSRLIKYFVTHLSMLREVKMMSLKILDVPLIESLQSSGDLQDEPLLRFYAEEWDRYTMGANYVNRLFTYLNRHWVKREREEGRRQVYAVYTLALDQWRTNLFIPIQQKRAKLATAIFRFIEMHRNGDPIDQGLIKKVIDSFVSIGIDRQDPDNTCLDVYKTEFETPFLSATEQYYTQESETFLANNTVSNYLKRTQERLQQEEDRVNRYLHASTRQSLLLKCEDVLIRKHRTVLLNDFRRMLDFDKEEDMQRMYILMSRLDDGLDRLRKQFEEHVKRMGQAAIEKLIGENSSGDSEAVDPKVYVDALLAVYEKNLHVVKKNFRDDSNFIASLDKACSSYINRNPATNNSSSKSPELLAKYADQLLRKTNKVAEEELELSLNRVMTVFKFIDNKDVFQTFYTSKLSKRLIYDASASDDAESSMISRLQGACGWDYTNKLERMFNDMRTSKEKTDNFKDDTERRHGSLGMSFTIVVGLSYLWPLNPPQHEFTVPSEMLEVYQSFNRWYKETIHKNHTLTWLWNFSKTELRTNYLNQKYIFMTSIYQSAVLLQYNRQDSLSFEHFKTATSLPQEIISQVLALLLKAKVLVLGDEDQYALNPGFKSKKIRVNLNQPIKAEVKKEETKVLSRVQDERKFTIQATIVRIMKARKTMKNQQLIQEVVSQVSQRFSPKIPDIKKALDHLLEHEYLERVDGTRDTYSYVA